MNQERPDPDQLLARLERNQAKAKRGRLKIFFGAAAGVGKTFAMLLAARERISENLDVVVGVVETHGRKETQVLVDGLEILPPRKIDYKGTTLNEFDIDAALKRRPAIILVDELAHSNAPGARHPKRWQDIQELLDAGIDVYTALNVQHLESLNDDIGQIAGIRVWETVPDTVFEEADEVELVDLPPDELLLRLKEGKIYLPQQAQEAVNHFFRKGNLIALRELSLRQTANRVDAQMLDYREDNAIHEVWQVSDRILVCIGSNALAERLIRAGKRLANSLRAEWIVAYVETPKLQRMPAVKRDSILRMLRLAEQLGAETVTLSATDMSEALIRFSRERNINKIVMGKPSRRGWQRWILGSLVDVLISQAHNINILLLGSPTVQSQADEQTEASLFKKSPLPGLKQRMPPKNKHGYSGYFWAIAVTLLTTALGFLMRGHLELANLVMVYLLGVVFVATRFGQGASILASLLSVACFDFLFVQPYDSFSVSDSQYLITLLVMLVVGLVISQLLVKVRSQAKVAAHRERRASALYSMTKELTSIQSEDDVVSIAVKHLHAEFNSPNVILFPNSHGRVVFPNKPGIPQSLRGADLSVAQWVFDHNEMAGQGTNTLPGAEAVYFPICDKDKVLGVVALLPINLRRVFLPEQQKLLNTFLDQIGQALARIRISEQARLTQTQMEAERMSNRVNHILDMARLEAGVLALNKQWYPLAQIIDTVLTLLHTPLTGRLIKVKLPEGIPMILADAVMIEQVLINLLQNALRYTPPGSGLEITAKINDSKMQIAVADHGPGIPKDQEEQLFEKFYQSRDETAQSGVGLGLAICRAIVEMHGGRICARNRSEGGAKFIFTLPLDQVPTGVAQGHNAN